MPGPRLAELVAGLSVMSDLGKGLVDGQGLRTCVLAMDLAERLRLPAQERETTFWVGLLRFVGCTATASQMAAALQDELAVSAAFAAMDTRDLRDVLRATVRAVGARPDRVARFLVRAPAVVREHEVTSCEVAQAVAARLGLGEEVVHAVGQVFERWDGKGHPGAAARLEIARPVRVWQVAHLADLVSQELGTSAVASALRHRAGAALDPEIAELCAVAAVELLADGARGSLTDVLAAEPAPRKMVVDEQLDAVLSVFGLLADLKSPCLLGHSERVAALAHAAAEAAGFPAADVVTVRRAGLVHDVGRVAVSSRIWDKAGPLTDGEREQVQLHPYYTQRVLSRVPSLSGLAELAGSHHERCDGSGYHRGLHGMSLPPLAAVLAAADCYVTSGEPRPHRAARSDTQRVELLRTAVSNGQLPARAVDAVLAAGGRALRPAPRPAPRPAARSVDTLTERERAVLVLVAQGLTNSAAARRLGVSPKTVNAHLEHTYAKLGVSTRVAAVVQAMQRGWLSVTDLERA